MSQATHEALLAEWQAAKTKASEHPLTPDVWPIGAMRQYDGLTLFQKIIAGELPAAPITQPLDFALVEAERGRVVFQGHPRREFFNPAGSVHGGYHAVLLDSCMSCAIHSTLGAGQGSTTIELKLNYLRPLSDQVGPVRAEGKVIHVGKQIGTAEGRLYDAAGRLYAHGTTSCMIFPV